MSNENNNTVAQILFLSELDRQAEAKRLELERTNQTLRTALEDSVKQADEERAQSQKALESEEDVSLALGYQLRRVRAHYAELLRQPLEVIAENNEDFKNNYEETQLQMSEWVISQKAYKELAIQFGEKLGYSVDQVIDLVFKTELDVLNDKHHPTHNTNAEGNKLLAPRKTALLQRLNAFGCKYKQLVEDQEIYDVLAHPPRNWAHSARKWLALAEKGDAKAQYNLGRCFARGEGVEKNERQAISWYLKAFEQQDPRSANSLFLLFQEENSDYFDVEKARLFARSAIEWGHAKTKPLLEQFERRREELLVRQQEEQQAKAEAARQQALEEQDRDVLESLSVIDTLNKNPQLEEMLERIKGRGHQWERAITAINNCRINLMITNVRNIGSLFRPSKVGDVYLKLENPSGINFQARIYGLRINGSSEQGGADFEIGRSGMIPLAKDLKPDTEISDVSLLLNGSWIVKLKIPAPFVVKH